MPWAVAVAGLSAAFMFMQLYPFEWAGTCRPDRPLCGLELCSVSGNWHIAWDLPLNAIGEVNAPWVLGNPVLKSTIGHGFAGYMIAMFLVPLLFGSWRIVLYHVVMGPHPRAIADRQPKRGAGDLVPVVDRLPAGRGQDAGAPGDARPLLAAVAVHGHRHCRREPPPWDRAEASAGSWRNGGPQIGDDLISGSAHSTTSPGLRCDQPIVGVAEVLDRRLPPGFGDASDCGAVRAEGAGLIGQSGSRNWPIAANPLG